MKRTHGWRLMMFRMSTTMDRSFIETAASRALCRTGNQSHRCISPQHFLVNSSMWSKRTI